MSESLPSDPSLEEERLGATPAEQVIALFGGIRPMAAKLSIPVTTVQGWKKRGQIPTNRHESIAVTAAALGLALDAALLAQAGIERENMSGPPPSPSTTEPGVSKSAETDDDRTMSVAAVAPSTRAASEPLRETGELPPSSPAERSTPLASAVPERRSGSALAGTALLVGLIALAATMTQPLWSPLVTRAIGVADLAALSPDRQAVEALRSEVESVRSALEAIERTTAAPNFSETPTELTQRLAALEAQVSDRAAADGDFAALSARLAAMEQGLAALGNRVQEVSADMPASLAAQRETLAQLTQQMLQTRLELQSLRREVQGNSLPQLQAQTRSLMLLQLRAVLQTGAPFAAELYVAAQQSAADPALQERLAPVFAALEPIAARGAPTATRLAAELPALARAAVQQERAQPGAGFWGRVLARLSAFVSIRTTPSAAVADGRLSSALALAEAALQRDDLAAAIVAVAAQQNPPAAVSEWLVRAQDRRTVDEAQAQIGQSVAQAMPRRMTESSAPLVAPAVETPPKSETPPAISVAPMTDPNPAAAPRPALDLPPMIGSP